MLVSDAVILPAVGNASTLMLAVPTLQPAIDAVYMVDAAGIAVTDVPVLADKPADGAHEYADAAAVPVITTSSTRYRSYTNRSVNE